MAFEVDQRIVGVVWRRGDECGLLRIVDEVASIYACSKNFFH